MQWWVTPYAGVWIEIRETATQPTRLIVTPYAGVWIEIYYKRGEFPQFCVTPYAGVWIEILLNALRSCIIRSLPTRECGLKLSLR